MGTYVYRVTAQTVQTPVGKANVAKFAYKPYGWDQAANSKMYFKSGCTASERMVANGNHTGLVALVNDDGTIESVFKDVRGNISSFTDDAFGNSRQLRTLYAVAYGGKMEFTARREYGTVRLEWTDYDLPANGMWIVRDQRGVVVDRDQYRNDLIERFPGLVVIDEAVAA